MSKLQKRVWFEHGDLQTYEVASLKKQSDLSQPGIIARPFNKKKFKLPAQTLLGSRLC